MIAIYVLLSCILTTHSSYAMSPSVASLQKQKALYALELAHIAYKKQKAHEYQKSDEQLMREKATQRQNTILRLIELNPALQSLYNDVKETGQHIIIFFKSLKQEVTEFLKKNFNIHDISSEHRISLSLQELFNSIHKYPIDIARTYKTIPTDPTKPNTLYSEPIKNNFNTYLTSLQQDLTAYLKKIDPVITQDIRKNIEAAIIDIEAYQYIIESQNNIQFMAEIDNNIKKLLEMIPTPATIEKLEKEKKLQLIEQEMKRLAELQQETDTKEPNAVMKWLRNFGGLFSTKDEQPEQAVITGPSGIKVHIRTDEETGTPMSQPGKTDAQATSFLTWLRSFVPTKSS